MRQLFTAATFAALAAGPAAQAQTVTTIAGLATATPCPALAFVSDAGKEGLFSPAASGTGAQANGGTTLACGARLYQRVYDGGAVNAKWFGLSEAAADNSAAVQNAINALRDGQELLIPEGSYRFQNTVHLPSNKFIRFTARGDLNFNQLDGIVIEGRHAVDLGKVLGNPWSANPAYDSFAGSAITLLNAAHTTVKVRLVEGFRNAIKFTGQGHNGSQYNKVDFEQLYQNDVGVLLTTESDGELNWVNENTITGGRIYGRTGVSAQPGSSQQDHFNGNKFYNIGFEGLTTGVDANLFAKNIFFAPRLEGVANGFKFSTTSYENLIIANALYETDFVSNGQAGNPGARTVLLGRLLVPGGSASGVFSVSDDNGRFLSMLRDPNSTTVAQSKGRLLPLASLPNVTP